MGGAAAPRSLPDNSLVRWAISEAEGNLKLALAVVERHSGAEVSGARKRKAAYAVSGCMDRVAAARPTWRERGGPILEDADPFLLECIRQAKQRHPWLFVGDKAM